MFIRGGTASTCLKAPYDPNSYQDFIWSVREEYSTTHLKHAEVELTDGGNGPLMTQPIDRRTEHGEFLSSPKMNSMGLTAW